MKNSNSNSKSKYIIIVNLFLIAILMVVGVYAWFAVSADNRVDAYDVQVNSDSNLELSFDQNTWSERLNLKDCPEYKNVKFVEVTGDGQSFRIPQLTQKDGYAVVNTSAQWKNATKNKDYLEFKVYMRSKDKLNVYLGSESKASPASKVITGANCGNQSSYGNFSKDCIVGALRVAAKNKDTFKFLWIPNPKIHLTNTVGSDIYEVNENSTSGQYPDGDGLSGGNYQWNDSYTHKYYDVDANNNKSLQTLPSSVTVTELPSTTGSTVPDGKYQIANLTKENDTDEYYTSDATFVVWIEGCDTEARRALVGGKFNISLSIDAFSAE